jgi:hypothetical protein
MTGIYEKHDLRFLYPENWRISEDDQGPMPWLISLETPEGGLWSVGIYPAQSDATELVSNSVQALKQQYEDVEVNEATSDVGGKTATGVDAYFYYLDFLIVAQIRVVATNRYTFVFYNQAESREFDKCMMVFHAIATSVVKND